MPRKPAERRQRRNTPEVGSRVVHEGGGGGVPELAQPGSPVLSETAEAWEAFWRSDSASLVDRHADLPALRRLFGLRDEWERTRVVYRSERLTEGSVGQVVLSPLARELASLETRITELEDRFGLTPQARLSLGVSFAQVVDARRRERSSRDEEDPRRHDPRPRGRAVADPRA